MNSFNWLTKLKIHLIFSLALLLFSVSCTDLDPVNERIDNLENELNELQAEINKIREAWESYKVVTDIQTLPDSEENGWLLKFTDGSSIIISNGQNGVTPVVRIDAEGFWEVSYDGTTYEFITDSEGNKINAIGINGNDGNDGNDGLDGNDGIDGNDGKDGECVRVVVNDSGNYSFEIYDPKTPDIPLETIDTPISSNPASAISSIVKDDISGKITITMGDGSIYVFELQKIVPSGIVLLTTDNISFNKKGQTKSLDIRVNPSNIVFNYNTNSEDCDLTLQYINTETSYNNNGTWPVIIDKIEPAKDRKGNPISGQYTLTLKDSGDNLLAYKEGVYLKLGYIDPNQEEVFISSDIFIVEYLDNTAELLNTGLPVMMISTPKEITSKTDWVEDCTIRVYEDSKFNTLYENVQIKGRGNSTWKYPKKPYALKLDSKEEVLGLKKHKRWVLLANYIDRTLMRNAVAFNISQRTDIEYTPSGEFIEVIFNGQHLGNYYLTEQIKVDKNRVNIAELDPTATSGDALTGGYLMEVDKYYDEVYKFRSKYYDYPWMFKDPDEVNIQQIDYMYNYVATMEEEINKLPEPSNYTEFLDIDSAIDVWMVNELMMNNEANLPQSMYFYKDINTKFKMGPVWDFDYATLRTLSPRNFLVNKAMYYEKLFQDPKFVAAVKEKWQKYYPKFQDVANFIDEMAKKIEKSQQINYDMWGCPSDPNRESPEFYTAVNTIKQAYLAKLNIMDQKIAEL